MAGNRLPCRRPDCRNTILQTTAEETGGLCRPCEQRLAREMREAFVRANTRLVDPFAGVTDPLRILDLLLEPPRDEELVRHVPFSGRVDELVQSLVLDPSVDLIGLALSALDDGAATKSENLWRWLAAFTSCDLSRLQDARVARGILYPGMGFRGAGADCARRILEFVPSATLRLNHALVALAWIGDATVCDLFAMWKSEPPSWAGLLHIPPHEYSLSAGWEIDEGGRRRDLFSRSAFALVPSSAPDAHAPVEAMRPASDRCPWCDGAMTALLSIDVHDARFAAPDWPETVVTCPACTCFGPVFQRVDDHGEAHWHPQNVRPMHAPTSPPHETEPTQRLVLGSARGPLHAADQFLPTTFSQIGGAPCWVQDVAYPRCPECGRTMAFVGQVAGEDVGPVAEGIYSAHWCATCHVTSTGYQQS